MTIFTTPKPFVGDTRVRQINALKSWKALHPDIEIIIFGDEEGTEDITSELGLKHISNVERNEFGTPLLNSMFSIAGEIGNYTIQAYINTDIVFIGDLRKVTEINRFKEFVVVGQRWDIYLTTLIDFCSPFWRELLLKSVKDLGSLHPPKGSDYFIFPRNTMSDMPPFAVGRTGWDNWVIYNCRRKHIPVINATNVITAIHLNHDYSHVKGNILDKENNNNIEMVGHLFYLYDANWIIEKNKLKRNYFGGGFIRTIRVFLIIHPELDLFRAILRWLRRTFNIKV